MALAFPLTSAQFIALLMVGEIGFDAPSQIEQNGTAGGEEMTAELGPMLWTGEVTLGTMLQAEAAVPEVLLDILRPSGRTFYAYDTRRPAPLADPTGAILGAATPTIASLNVNNRDISLTGLPVGYVLTRGDYLAFTYATTRRALHRVVAASIAANGSGVTAQFEVTPMIRPGATVGAAVLLIKADCKAVLDRASVNKGKTSQTVNRGMTFRFKQTLR